MHKTNRALRQACPSEARRSDANPLPKTSSYCSNKRFRLRVLLCSRPRPSKFQSAATSQHSSHAGPRNLVFSIKVTQQPSNLPLAGAFTSLAAGACPPYHPPQLAGPCSPSKQLLAHSKQPPAPSAVRQYAQRTAISRVCCGKGRGT